MVRAYVVVPDVCVLLVGGDDRFIFISQKNTETNELMNERKNGITEFFQYMNGCRGDRRNDLMQERTNALTKSEQLCVMMLE